MEFINIIAFMGSLASSRGTVTGGLETVEQAS